MPIDKRKILTISARDYVESRPTRGGESNHLCHYRLVGVHRERGVEDLVRNAPKSTEVIVDLKYGGSIIRDTVRGELVSGTALIPR